MSYNLFIDDVRSPGDAKWAPWYGRVYPWVVVRSLSEFEELVKAFGVPQVISFDHDLGDEPEPSGYNIAQLLAERVMDGEWVLPDEFTFYVHSLNPVGAENITKFMLNFLAHVK